MSTAQAKRPPLPEPASLTEIAYRYIREELLSRRFDFEMPLRQEVLADELRMSRLPVREALMRLEVEGLITLRPRRGYVVSSLDESEIREIFEVRGVLEQHAAFIATERRTTADIAEVESLLQELEGLSTESPFDIAGFIRCNRAFHQRMLATSGRQILGKMMLFLGDNVERYTRIGSSFVTDLSEVNAEHRRLLDAFAGGRPSDAARLALDHCNKTLARLLANLRQHAVIK